MKRWALISTGLLCLTSCGGRALAPSSNTLSVPVTHEVKRVPPVNVSIAAREVDLRVLLNTLAQLANIHLVIGNEVEGKATLNVQALPWPQVLRELARTHGLVMRQQGEVVWINRTLMLGELETVQIPLRYQRAEALKQSLNVDSSGRAPFLSKSGLVVIDQRTNQLFISDIPERIAAIRQIVEWLDVPTRQVDIEVQIVEADDGFGRSLGARLGYVDKSTPQSGLALAGNLNGIMTTTGQVATGGDVLTNSQIVNLPANGLAGHPAATLAGSLFSAKAQQYLNVELSALENSGKGKVLSRPRLVTADQLSAVIEQGTELPYQQTSANGNVQVSFRKANLRLEVQPQITPDNTIALVVEVNKDTVGQETRAGFAIDSKHIKTQVTVEDGGTVMLGGIESHSERETETKVPWFGDIPGLGWLFKSKTKNQGKVELLVFITPRIIPLRP